MSHNFEFFYRFNKTLKSRLKYEIKYDLNKIGNCTNNKNLKTLKFEHLRF